MVEKAVRKTTTKKPVRKAAPKKAAPKVATTKKPATKTVVRKAPTPVAAKKASEKKSTQLMLAGVIMFLCILIGSIVLGVSGSGRIDIDNRISDLKEQATPEERTRIDSIPVTQKTSLPDGGLVPSGVPELVPTPDPVASTTDASATSTDAVATSTPATPEETSSAEAVEESLQEEPIEPEATPEA